MERNPYAAPRVEIGTAELTAEDQQLASRGQRLANLLLDSVGYYTIAFVVAFVLTLVDPALTDRIAEHSWMFSFSVILLYYVPSEALFGRTPAKLVTGTRTVTETGQPPGFRQVLGRSLARLVPFEPFSCLGDPPIGWHDRWSGTRVVRTRPVAGGITLAGDSPYTTSGPLGL